MSEPGGWRPSGWAPARWQALVDAAWPAARLTEEAPWTFRATPGAGGRVNAISRPDGRADGIGAAERHARAEGRRPSFVVWPGQAALDAALAARGYLVADAVNVWAADARRLAGDPLPPATAFPVWPPLAAMRDLWAAGGIGPERQAVMARAAAGAGVLARVRDRTAGAAFVGVHDGTALLSALYVLPARRRGGAGGLLLRAAARWAAERGAVRLVLFVERENAPAAALYASSGMEIVEGYHYRRPPPPT